MNRISLPRRTFLNKSLALLMGIAWPMLARTKSPTPLTSFQVAMISATGGRKPVETDQIKMEVPAIAENGAIVPITLESLLSETSELIILVEKNPVPLVALFVFENDLDPWISTRIKMNESCDVIAVAKVGDQYFVARKAVKVMVGGCG